MNIIDNTHNGFTFPFFYPEETKNASCDRLWLFYHERCALVGLSKFLQQLCFSTIVMWSSFAKAISWYFWTGGSRSSRGSHACMGRHVHDRIATLRRIFCVSCNRQDRGNSSAEFFSRLMDLDPCCVLCFAFSLPAQSAKSKK